MTSAPAPRIFCLDANVLIQAWNTYYSPRICPDYWEALNELGNRKRIFLPEEISDEITRTDDDLSKWLKASKIPIRATDVNVTNCWKRVLATHNDHQYLIAETKNRSLGDPWVISHAIDAGATVVTKEELETTGKPLKIKIPNVCNNMGVSWMNDFKFIQDLQIQFSCRLP